MPEITVIQKGVTPAVRTVPTATCAVVMPMTLERVDKEAASANEELKAVESVDKAFEQFHPKLSFTGYAGEDETEFKADFRFRTINDFEPETLQKRQEVEGHPGEFHRNDIADLRSNIDLLYRLRDRWRRPEVRKAWSNIEQRREIVEGLARLRTELEKVAAEGGKG